MKSKKKLVEEYIQKIISKLCYEYGTSLEDARKAVEELDLLNTYKGNYDFVLYQNVSTWVNLIVDRHKKEVEAENMKKKTIIKPQSNHLLVYDEQPTIENTKCGDVVLYKKEVWINDGHIVTSIPSKEYVDEKVEKTLKENTMENYIVINGKKAELTKEQLNYLCMFNRFAQMAKEQFGLTITPKETVGETFKTLFGVDFSDCSERKNPFNSELEDEDSYFLIDDEGVNTGCYNPIIDKHRLDNINSFNDKDFANQVYLHELLNRKLLKYAWDNEAEDGEWNGENLHYYIFLDTLSNKFRVEDYFNAKTLSTIYFSNKKVAKQAIKDVIEPFIKEHPEFVW